ncbi:MAG: M48 family metallopeptidase [Pseudomonadota bacterium]
MQFKGKLYSQGSSAFADVMVSIGNYPEFNVLCVDSGEIHHSTLDNAKINPKLGTVPREIAIDELGLLVVDSEPSLDAWLDQHQSSRIHKYEKSKKLVLLSVVAVPLVLFGLFKYVLPATAITFAAWVPQGAVNIASHHTLIALERTVLSPTTLSDDYQIEVTEYWYDLIEQLEIENDDFYILFYQSDVFGANAFALPDGTIVFTQELVELFERDRDLLTAVLLHEIGHVEHNHSMRLIAETLITSLALSYFFGDVSGLFELFGGTTTTIIQNQYTQDLEWEADNYAIGQMQNAGLQPQVYADAMIKLAEEYGEGGGSLEAILSTHPSLKARIENAQNAQ